MKIAEINVSKDADEYVFRIFYPAKDKTMEFRNPSFEDVSTETVKAMLDMED